MKPNAISASRIKQLREKAKLNQNDFSREFSEFMNRPTPIATMSISNWETGKSLPPTDTLIWLATYFNVSVDYILGLSDENGNLNVNTSISKFENIEVPYSELSKHDGAALYVKFPSGEYKDQFGLLDYSKKQIVFIGFKMVLNNKCKYFLSIPSDSISLTNQASYLLNLKDVMKMDRVYIQSLAPDPFIAGQVTGWYKNDVSGEFLINDAGRTLSYEGLGVTYNAIDFKVSLKKKN